MQQGLASAIGMALGIIAMFIIMMVCGTILGGYYTLYAHDRALNKNAQLRDILDCVPDAFFVGAKNFIFGFIIIFVFDLLIITFY